MVWRKTLQPEAIQISNLSERYPNRYWLVYNEPNLQGQANMDPSVAVANYCGYVEPALRGKAKIILGGAAWLDLVDYWRPGMNGLGGYEWMEQFLSMVPYSQRPAGVHIHFYIYLPADPNCPAWLRTSFSWAKVRDGLQRFRWLMKAKLGEPTPQFWITETGYIWSWDITPRWVRDNFMVPLKAEVLDQVTVNRVARFTACPIARPYTGYNHTKLKSSATGGLTALGTQWNSYTP